jgi:hypothetical protein
MYRFNIVGGFITKEIANIVIKKTNLWTIAQIIINKKPIYTLTSQDEQSTSKYFLEHSEFNNTYSLILNESTIYQDKEKFNYDIEFTPSNNNDYSKHNMYSFIEYVSNNDS